MKNTKDIHIIRNFDNYFSITDAIEEMGLSYEAPVLENKVIEANKFIAERLQLPLAAKVCSFKKLRIVEGQPMCIEQIYVDYDEVPALPKTDMTDRSFYAWCKETYGYEVMRDEEEIKVVHASVDEAKLLHLQPNSEVMMLEGTSYKEKLKPFEYFQIISIPGFYRFRSVNHHAK